MPIGKPLIQLFEVDSTNNYAMGQVQAALAGHGTAWFAHSQTTGKGQRGKSWISAPGQNILLSVALNCSNILFEQQFLLSAMVAVASHDFFSVYAGEETKIKWPNDIYWKDRKAGGILIENLVKGKRWKFSIAGIGLNINQKKFDAALVNPVSLTQITGRQHNALVMAGELCTCLEKRWQQLISGKEEEILTIYHKNMYKLNNWVTLKVPSKSLKAQVKGVNKNGELLINTHEHGELAIREAEWLII